MITKPDAVVFDMDGVIFDSERIYRLMEHREAARYGLPDELVEPFCDRIAGGTKDTNRHHFEEMFGTDIDYFVFRQGVNEGVDAYGRDPGFDVKPGIEKLLHYLKEQGIRIGLATSTAHERAEYQLKKHNLYDFFDEIVYGNMVAKGKPNPDIYLYACEKLGTAPECTIGVEDSINGVISSKRAGLFTVMVIDLIKPNDVVKEHADAIFTNAEEIIGLIEEGCL
ncbi:MAG: HAD family phosphatase [Eubacterium sp.]|nr:HAD family phosphatase [Eubacterium sp.]